MAASVCFICAKGGRQYSRGKRKPLRILRIVTFAANFRTVEFLLDSSPGYLRPRSSCSVDFSRAVILSSSASRDAVRVTLSLASTLDRRTNFLCICKDTASRVRGSSDVLLACFSIYCT